MDRVGKLAQVWNWLPAFRAVAETENVQEAARLMHVSASALSRSVRLLENKLGTELFVRQGRRVVLSASGRELLLSLRTSMRALDDHMSQGADDALHGRVRIAADGQATMHRLTQAAVSLRQSAPALTLVIERKEALSLPALIVRGDFDLALVEEDLRDPALRICELGPLHYGVYCGARHPLFSVPRVRRAQILEHVFVAPVPDEHGRRNDFWPHEVPRQIVLEVGDAYAAVHAAVYGPLLACLPTSIAEHFVRAEELRALRTDFDGAKSIFALSRRPVGGPAGKRSLTTRVVAQLEKVLLELA